MLGKNGLFRSGHSMDDISNLVHDFRHGLIFDDSPYREHRGPAAARRDVDARDAARLTIENASDQLWDFAQRGR